MELLGVRRGAAGPEPVLAPAGLDAAARHRAVTACAREGVFAPARRGAGFADAEAARAWAERSAAPLACLLDRLEGCAELVWSRSQPAPPEPPDRPHGYLRAQGERLAARRAMAEAAGQEAEQLQRRFEPMARETLLRLWETPAAVGADVCALARWEAVAALQAAAPGGWRCTGPWPPYSFAELPDV